MRLLMAGTTEQSWIKWEINGVPTIYTNMQVCKTGFLWVLCALWSVINFSICLSYPHGTSSSLAPLPAVQLSSQALIVRLCHVGSCPPWNCKCLHQHQGRKVRTEEESRTESCISLLAPMQMCCASNDTFSPLPGWEMLSRVSGKEDVALGMSHPAGAQDPWGKWEQWGNELQPQQCSQQLKSSRFSFSHGCRYNVCLSLIVKQTEKQTNIGDFTDSQFNNLPFSSGSIYNSQNL